MRRLSTTAVLLVSPRSSAAAPRATAKRQFVQVVRSRSRRPVDSHSESERRESPSRRGAATTSRSPRRSGGAAAIRPSFASRRRSTVRAKRASCICALWGDNASCDERHYDSHTDSRRDPRHAEQRRERRVPRAAPARRERGVNTVNGDVTVDGATADVEANTVNGEVDIATSGGRARGNNVNGGVRARLGKLDPDGSMSFTTVNGNVTVDFAGDSGADLDLQTMNGTLNTNFEMTLVGRLDPKHLRSHVGRPGGPGSSWKRSTGTWTSAGAERRRGNFPILSVVVLVTSPEDTGEISRSHARRTVARRDRVLTCRIRPRVSVGRRAARGCDRPSAQRRRRNRGPTGERPERRRERRPPMAARTLERRPVRRQPQRQRLLRVRHVAQQRQVRRERLPRKESRADSCRCSACSTARATPRRISSSTCRRTSWSTPRCPKGSVRIDGVAAGVTAHTANGDVEVTNASGPLSLETANGDVRLSPTALTGSRSHHDLDDDERHDPRAASRRTPRARSTCRSSTATCAAIFR